MFFTGKDLGSDNLAALIELGYLSVVAYEASDAEDLTLLGFAVFNDAPPKEPEKAELWFAALRGICLANEEFRRFLVAHCPGGLRKAAEGLS